MLRKTRRREKKTSKKLTLAEDRSYAAGFEKAVNRVHGAGWDYKKILGDFEDPITRAPEPDLPLEVSSSPETYLSD